LKHRQPNKICVKARQIGFSYIIAVEAVLRCYTEGCNQLIVSVSQRQANEVLEKCKRVDRLFARFPSSTLPPATIEAVRGNELHFTNGARIIGLPRNPETIRGFTGDVFIDEFAHFRNDNEIFKAVVPTITRGYRLTIVSTPNGQMGKFFEIWNNPDLYENFSRFKIDIFEAQRGGLSIDLDAVRKRFDDETFRQEYCCEFVDEATAVFPYALIRSCVGSFSSDEPAARTIGIDIGRRNDLTCLYILESRGDKLYTRRIDVLKQMRFEEQRAVIRQVIREEGVSRGCIDETGIGMQLAEELNREFGFLDGVSFTPSVREQMVIMTRRKFEEKLIEIPDDEDLIADIHEIRKTLKNDNRVHYGSRRTSAGHADRFWAMALAVRAAENGPQLAIRYLD
jgi:phage FluMu gp28-like protein